MNHALKNMLAVVVGIIGGGLINMAIVMLSPYIVPPPEGVNMADTESLQQSAHLLTTAHFIPPLFAHAIGTFCGALLATMLAFNNKHLFAYLVGCFFLLGGITAATMIPAPVWFLVVDLGLAYLPMAFLAIKTADKIHSMQPPPDLQAGED